MMPGTMKTLFSAGFLVLLSFNLNCFAGEEQKFVGTWHNQWGSEMRLAVDTEGRVSGKYHSAVGRKEVTTTEAWFDITGVVNGDVISFVVSWGPTSGAISAWSGHYLINKAEGLSVPQIRTLTQTSLRILEPTQWQRTVAGTDIFEPGPASKATK